MRTCDPNNSPIEPASDAWLASEMVPLDLYQQVRAPYLRALRQHDREQRWAFPAGFLRLHSADTILGKVHEARLQGAAIPELLEAFTMDRPGLRVLTLALPAFTQPCSLRLHVANVHIAAQRQPDHAHLHESWFTLSLSDSMHHRLLAGNTPTWFEIQLGDGATIACPAKGIGRVLTTLAIDASQASLLSVLRAGAEHDAMMSKQ